MSNFLEITFYLFGTKSFFYFSFKKEQNEKQIEVIHQHGLEFYPSAFIYRSIMKFKEIEIGVTCSNEYCEFTADHFKKNVPKQFLFEQKGFFEEALFQEF